VDYEFHFVLSGYVARSGYSFLLSVVGAHYCVLAFFFNSPRVIFVYDMDKWILLHFELLLRWPLKKVRLRNCQAPLAVAVLMRPKSKLKLLETVGTFA